MTAITPLRCAIYTRKSSDEGLDQSFNSLRAQREACEAYIKSQVGEGWGLRRERYDDGGHSGGTMNRPALRRLMSDVAAGRVGVVVVYKVDRLTRSLSDFAKIIEAFDKAGVSFVSITQAFNTTTSMGRLTLNVLLSFAQFEREVTGERIRDKIAASKAKGMWMGGLPPLGYDPPSSQISRALVVNEAEAEAVRQIFSRYLESGNTYTLQQALVEDGLRSKRWVTKRGRHIGNSLFSRGALQHLLSNRTYLGEIVHKGVSHPGRHAAIIDEQTFTAVQDLLDRGRQTRRERVPKATTALLWGLLFDGDGHPMKLVIAGRRHRLSYRYYASPSAWPGVTDSADDDTIRRVPAAAVEGLVLHRLAAIAQISGSDLDRETLRTLVARVEIHASSIHLVIRSGVLGAMVTGRIGVEGVRRQLLPGERVMTEPHDARLIRILLPVRLKMRGGRNWITGADGQAVEPASAPDKVLIRQVRAAHAILRACGAQPDASNSQLRYARAPKSSHQMAQVRWAFLAPDIQKDLMEGRAAAEGFARTGPRAKIPLLWSEQRAMFRNSLTDQGDMAKDGG
jgi:DNA invertase Pin-like site-specific DNA recombinase